MKIAEMPSSSRAILKFLRKHCDSTRAALICSDLLDLLPENSSQGWPKKRVALHGELDRLLDLRIAGFKSRLWINLSIAYLVTLIAFGALAAVGLSITRGTRRLIDRMESLAKGDLATPIPYGDDRYDLGKLASAIGVFRSTLMEVEWPAAGLMTRHLPSFGIGQGAKLC